MGLGEKRYLGNECRMGAPSMYRFPRTEVLLSLLLFNLIPTRTASVIHLEAIPKISENAGNTIEKKMGREAGGGETFTDKNRTCHDALSLDMLTGKREEMAGWGIFLSGGGRLMSWRCLSNWSIFGQSRAATRIRMAGWQAGRSGCAQTEKTWAPPESAGKRPLEMPMPATREKLLTHDAM